MGKTTTTKDPVTESKSRKSCESISSHKVTKHPTKPHGQTRAEALNAVELPKSADGLTADQLTENQKHVFKRHCQEMYGHRFSDKRKLPANSLEAATSQLAAKMQEKLAQRKKDKQKKKETNK